MNKVVLLCRPGFEKECAAEITDKAGQREIFGFARVKENAGYVIYECYQPDDGDKLIRELPFSSLIFARQWFVVGELLQHLPPEDRITPIVGMLQGVVEKGGELRVEVADTNESKELLKFCRKFTSRYALPCVMRGCWRTMKRRSVRLCMYSLLHQAVAILVTHTAAIIRRSIWAFRA